MDSAPIALGAYVRGYPARGDAMDAYAQLVGRWPAIIHVFRNWTDASRDFDPKLADKVASSGAALMITWQPPAASMADIAAGEQDAYVREYARTVRAWSGQLLLRVAHEMNGDWIPWRADPATYRAAWRRMRAIFDEEGAESVAWVWSPHVRDARAAPFAPFFPGADVVDWLALDGYNWGRSQSGSHWQSFDDVYADGYGEVLALAEKPVMLAEIGCAEEGGDKAAWVREAFLDAIPSRYPRVRAVTWFHAHPRGHADWRVDSSPASLEAHREVARSPLYAGAISLS